jgi:hypothetical protein
VVLHCAETSRQDEQRRILRCAEPTHTILLAREEDGDGIGPCVPDIQPDHLGREALEEASLSKVSVFDTIVKP